MEEDVPAVQDADSPSGLHARAAGSQRSWQFDPSRAAVFVVQESLPPAPDPELSFRADTMRQSCPSWCGIPTGYTFWDISTTDVRRIDEITVTAGTRLKILRLRCHRGSTLDPRLMNIGIGDDSTSWYKRPRGEQSLLRRYGLDHACGTRDHWPDRPVFTQETVYRM